MILRRVQPFLNTFALGFNPNQSGMPSDSKGGPLLVFKDQLAEEAGRGGGVGTSAIRGKIARL